MENSTYLLLIDADVSNRIKFHHALEQVAEPCIILEATDRKEALSILSGRESPDLVLTDGCLPGLAYRDVLELLEKHRPTVPLLFVPPAGHHSDGGAELKREAHHFAFQCDLAQLPLAAWILLETPRKLQAALRDSEERFVRTLQILNDAALAAQQARTSDEVYKVISKEMNLLGYRTFVLSLSHDATYLTMEGMAISSDLLARVERVTGLSADTYQIPVAFLAAHQTILEQHEALFVPDLVPTITKAVPATIRPLAQKIAGMLGLHQGVLAPLVVGGQAKGILAVSADAMSKADVPAVTAFADQISAALERAHLFAELQEREWRATVAYKVAQQYADELIDKVREEQVQLREISALHRVAAVTAEELTTEAVMERGLTTIMDLFQLDGAAIYLTDDQTQVRLVSGLGMPDAYLDALRANPLPLTELYAGPAVLSGEPMLIEDLEDIAWPLPDRVREVEARTVANLPLRAGGRLIGLLALHALRPRALVPADLPLLTNIATQFATTLENARLFEQEQQRRGELDRLNNALRLFANQLQECLDETAIARLLCEVVCDTLAWDRAVVSLRDDETMTSRVVAFQGYPPDIAEQLASLSPMPFGDNRWRLKEYCISHSYNIPDPFFTLKLNEEKWLAEAWQAPYLLLVPLEAGGRILGTLSPASMQGQNHPTRQQIEHLELFATQAAIAIESIRLTKLVRMWADAVRHSGDAIVITDIEGKILSVNPAFEALTGYHPANAVGQTPRILKSNLTTPSLYDEMWDTILTGKIWRGEVINRRKDGSVYDADLTIAPILDREEQIIGFIGSQRDISRLKELDRLKTQFVSNVSHELRTPLTNIRLYQRYLRENRRPELHDRFFDILDRETNRLGQIIENLLDLSRLEASTTTLKTVPFDLNRLVEEIATQYRVQAKEGGLTLTYELTDTSLQVMADQTQIAQAITNLLMNSLSYTPAGGGIHIVTHSTDDEAAVSIRDTGYGIAQEEIEQVFDRFFRGEASRKAEAAGTGLGLAIVKQIVDLHRGRLQVESKVGQGSTFTLSLPVQSTVS